jgi:hypothetical protein
MPEALPLAEAATGICRRLARTGPRTYLPDLARALTQTGMLRSYLGWEAAVPPAQEATRLYRRLTRTQVDAMPDVAGSLSSLLTFLWEMSAICRAQTPDPTDADSAP